MQKPGGRFLLGGGIAAGCLGVVLSIVGLGLIGVSMRGPGENPSREEAQDEENPDSNILGKLFKGGQVSTEPADARIDGGRPVGLFFMTRFWGYTGTLEKKVWYFTPDGQVYEDIEFGFGPAELEAHKGRKGTATANGNQMTVTWADGKTTTSDVEIDEDGVGFAWDGGLFTPVKRFDSSSVLVGKWEGGESLSHGGNTAAVSKTLEFREDHTFTWDSVGFVKGETDESIVSAGAGGGTTGEWSLVGYLLTLSDANGTTMRGIAFPYDDEETPVNPDRFYFSGTMYKRQ